MKDLSISNRKEWSLFNRKSVSFDHWFLQIVHSWYFFLLVVLVCTSSYLFWDLKITGFMYTHVSHEMYTLMQKVTEIANGTVYFIGFFTLFVIFKLLKKERIARICLFIFLSLVFAGFVCEILKIVLGRYRPELYINHHLYGFTFFKLKAPMQSFPSGHTVNITALMVALCFLFKRYWPLFVLILLALSFSRVILYQHYLSDMIFGIYLSILTVSFLRNSYWFRRNL